MLTARQRPKPLGLFLGEATPLLADGYDIRTVQELLGHKDVGSTMIYAHVLSRGGRRVRSPGDGLAHRPDERQAETAYHAETGVTMRQVPTAIRLMATDYLRVRLQTDQNPFRDYISDLFAVESLPNVIQREGHAELLPVTDLVNEGVRLMNEDPKLIRLREGTVQVPLHWNPSDRRLVLFQRADCSDTGSQNHLHGRNALRSFAF